MRDKRKTLDKKSENLKFKKQVKKRKYQERGITLIALVVTIIVLLILTGVTLNMTLADNGLFSRAKEAVEKYEKAEKDESRDISILEEMIDGKVTDVNEVTDKNPGKLELESETYIINSIEDLVFFANDVSKGNSYERKTVKLGISLDFNSSKSYVEPYRTDYKDYGYDGKLKKLLTSDKGFKPIGGEFKGTFDGNGFKLYNLPIYANDEGEQCFIGMFEKNYGVIQNVGIDNLMLSCQVSGRWDSIGGLVGINGGEISNCYVIGDITCNSLGESINLGGITGINRGTISRSFVDVDLAFNASAYEGESKGLRIGGVTGVNGDYGESCAITNVYNIGELSVEIAGESTSTNEIYFGGVIGWDIKGKVLNCYSIAPMNIVRKNISTLDGCCCWETS